jgi:hypothetical protein
MFSLGRIYNYKILVAKLVNVLVAVCFVGHKSILQWYLLKELPYVFRALLIIDSKISTHNLNLRRGSLIDFTSLLTRCSRRH